MNPINIQYCVKIIMPQMLRRLYPYNLLISNIRGYLIISNIKGKILLTDTFIYPLEAYHEVYPIKQTKGELLARP